MATFVTVKFNLEKLLKLFFSKTVLLATSLVAINAMAQSVPPLPGKIEPGAKDTSYFVCSVYPVNNDLMARNMTGSEVNLWTEAVKGGKFELIKSSSVRVMAPNVEAARNDLYAFYQKYAAAAFIRGPGYDKGGREMKSVVEKCEPDSTRATNVNITSISKDKFISLDSDLDHVSYATKLLKTPLEDEKLALMFYSANLPLDVFERKDLLVKRAAKAKELIQKAGDSKFVKISGLIKIPSFSFESNSFALANLKDFVESYTYLKKSQSGQYLSSVTMPAYEVTIPATMMAYKPATTEEAKLIERERAAPELTLISYVQVSGAEFVKDRMRVKGVLSKIDVLNAKGTVLFSISAR